MNAKKAGLLALAFLVISAQSSCGTDKAQQTEEEVQEVAEAPAEEQEETQPEITPGEMQGPQLCLLYTSRIYKRRCCKLCR